MPLNVETFRNLVNQTNFGNRDIVVSGEGKNATARLGNFFFSQGKTVKPDVKGIKDYLETSTPSLYKRDKFDKMFE